MSDSYLEKCIQALPPEKQPAARAAIKAISETGDDSILSKVLVAFEATTAYAETIPHAIVASGEKLLQELDARAARAAAQQAESEAQREARLRQLIAEQVPQLGKTLALDKVVARIDMQTAEISRLTRSADRLRQARVGGLVLLMTPRGSGGRRCDRGPFLEEIRYGAAGPALRRPAHCRRRLHQRSAAPKMACSSPSMVQRRCAAPRGARIAMVT